MPTSQPPWSKSGTFFIFPIPELCGDWQRWVPIDTSFSAPPHPRPPQELTPCTLWCNRPPHPNQERLCQCDLPPKKLPKDISLSSCSSCLSLSFPYSFVVNGLGGKWGWKGTACPACSPSPMLSCLHPSSLGSFLPKSLDGVFPLFFFSSPRPAHPVPLALGNRLLHSLPELLPGGRLSLSPTWGPPGASHISHTCPPHGSCHPSALPPQPRPWGPCVHRGHLPCSPLPPFVPSIVPWAAGGRGWPHPCAWLLNKPPAYTACLPCVVPRAVGLRTLWGGQGRAARSQIGGIWPFSGLPS